MTASTDYPKTITYIAVVATFSLAIEVVRWFFGG